MWSYNDVTLSIEKVGGHMIITLYYMGLNVRKPDFVAFEQ